MFYVTEVIQKKIVTHRKQGGADIKSKLAILPLLHKL